MIGKQIKGKDFSRCLNYVITKPGASVIGGSLLSLSPKGASRELQEVAAMSPRTQKPLLHCALSLAAGESLSNHQWRMLTEDYLKALGYIDNQFLLVRHSDTPTHEHVHVVVNRVGLDGKTVSDSWDYMRSQAVIHDLETEYGLSHAPLSWEKRTPKPKRVTAYEQLFSEPALSSLPPAVRQEVKWQRQLRNHLNGALVATRDLESFSEHLIYEGVELRLLYRQGKAVGISFQWEEKKIAGSRLGAAYSLPKLLAAMKSASPPAIPPALSPLSPVTPGTDQEIPAEQQDAERPSAIRQPEPELPRQFSPEYDRHRLYRKHYATICEQIRQQLGDPCTQEQIDLQFALLILRSGNPQLKHVLAQSPDIQRRLREQGEDAAWGYGRELMARAQQWLDDFQQQSRDRRDELERD